MSEAGTTSDTGLTSFSVSRNEPGKMANPNRRAPASLERSNVFQKEECLIMNEQSVETQVQFHPISFGLLKEEHKAGIPLIRKYTHSRLKTRVEK